MLQSMNYNRPRWLVGISIRETAAKEYYYIIVILIFNT